MNDSTAGEAPAPPRHQKTFRWLTLFVILAVLAAAFLVPLIKIDRYHRTISETLARSIGHPVRLGEAKLQLFGRPGLSISDVTVYEDPRFGSEPLLYSPSVVVSLRFSSLWRRHMEVSRIDLDDASVNLVRNASGEWNIGSVLEQASRTPNAPTAQRHAGGSPRFPYIEFRSARINFKEGNEKKGFSFESADFSIWLDNPNQWRLRFEAQPIRTDLSVDSADMGLIRAEGSLNRAAYLNQMPVNLHVEWNGAALGQASQMLFVDDTGWRGELRAEADVTGDLSDLHLKTRLRVANAHRQEFTPRSPFDIDARCNSDYRHQTQSLENLTCLWPVENGHLLLTGSIQNISHLYDAAIITSTPSKLSSRAKAAKQPKPGSPSTGLRRWGGEPRDLQSAGSTVNALNLEINQTPAAFGLNVLRLLRPRLSPDLEARGIVNGHFTWQLSDAQSHRTKGGMQSPALTGEATAEGLTLLFPNASKPIAFPALHFETPGKPQAETRHRRTPARTTNIPNAHEIILEPAAMDLGAPNPVQLSGKFTAQEFSLRLAGQAQIANLAGLSPALGPLRNSIAKLAPQGTADLDLTLSSPWLIGSAGPSSATMQGWMHLQHAQAKLDWLPEPVAITAAALDFDGSTLHWSNASLIVNGVTLHGSADFPATCVADAGCPAHFNLDLPNLDAAILQSSLLGAGRHGELLDTILAQVGRKTAPWPASTGQVEASSLQLGTLILHNVRTAMNIREHRLEIASFDAATLGGELHASGTVDASGATPHYTLELNWSGINIAQASTLFHEKWTATGTMDGRAHLSLQGYATEALASSAEGTFHWVWNNGSLLTGPSTSGNALQPTRFNRWIAIGKISSKTLTLDHATAANPVSGTITFDRKLDLEWPGKNEQGARLTGTLTKPAAE
jgi:hypothetical protein